MMNEELWPIKKKTFEYTITNYKSSYMHSDNNLRRRKTLKNSKNY